MITLLACAGGDPPRVLPVGGDPARVEVHADTPDITVWAPGADAPMAGVVSRSPTGWVLRPAAPLVLGRTYQVRAGDEQVEWEVPAAEPEPFTVDVWPSTPDLPQNALKLYLRSSVPIRRPELGEARWIDDRGEAVELAFATPLLAPDRRLVTLLFHPGRQKQDIGFGAGVAPILEEGRRYELVFPLVDTTGRRQEVRRTFVVGAVDREPPDPSRWTARVEGDGVRVGFDEPMDAVLAPMAFTVDGRPTAATLGPGERSVRLAAAPGSRIALAGRIEDRAANQPDRPFEGRAGDRPPAPTRWSVIAGP